MVDAPPSRDPLEDPSVRTSPEAAFAQRVIAAREEERRRIARELHDDTSQALTSLLVGLESLRLHGGATPALEERIATLREIARDALSGISRLIRGLRPAELEGRSLAEAIAAFSGHLETIYGTRVYTHTLGDRPIEIAPRIESGLYRMIQEAMTNAAKHALAERINVTLHLRQHSLRAVIEDDGVGFSEQDLEGRGVGLTGLAERAVALGGGLRVESTPGEGTIVAIDVPLRDASS